MLDVEHAPRARQHRASVATASVELLHGVPEDRRERLDVARLFRDVVPRAEAKQLNDQLLIADAGHDDRRQREPACGEFLEHIRAVHVGQVVIQHQRLEPARGQLCETPAPGIDDLERDVGGVLPKMRTRQIRIVVIVFSVEHANRAHRSPRPFGGATAQANGPRGVTLG